MNTGNEIWNAQIYLHSGIEEPQDLVRCEYDHGFYPPHLCFKDDTLFVAKINARQYLDQQGYNEQEIKDLNWKL